MFLSTVNIQKNAIDKINTYSELSTKKVPYLKIEIWYFSKTHNNFYIN